MRLTHGFSSFVTHTRRLTTRIVLSAISVAGICIVGAAITTGTAQVAAANPITLTETWNSGATFPGVILDDAPCGVAEDSPVQFDDGGTRAVEVGDREGSIYGLNLQNGSSVPGWDNGTGSGLGSGQGCNNPTGGTPATGSIGVEVPGSPPIDSTASVGPTGNLYFGAGNAAAPIDGGYYSYGPNGSELWNQVVTNPSSDTVPNGGVQASLSIGDGGSLVEAGSLGQETYALEHRERRRPHPAWPQFSADSVFSTAAVGDLYGTGSDDFVSGGASSQGFAYGKHYSQRRPPPDLQRQRRSDLQRQHDRGGRLVAGHRSDPLRWGTMASPRVRAASSAAATKTRSRSSTPSATRSGATSSTARPAAGPRSPT